MRPEDFRRDLVQGSNSYGSTGTGPGNVRTPKQVGSDGGWEMVDSGTGHACAIRSGQLWCWGAGMYGRFGTGTTDNQFAPVRIGEHSDWNSVSAGNFHTCGVRSGMLFCWGDGGTNRLGLGADTGNKLEPQRVGTDDDWTSATAGYGHSCAIKANGELYCWGSNWTGSLGDGTTTQRAVPTREFLGFTDWADVQAGDNSTCGRRSGGEIYCWGYNRTGEVGDGTVVRRNRPTHVSPGSLWADFSFSRDHVLGMSLQ
jgi:alpha-tubulin suppressor-like RCC1 family protein